MESAGDGYWRITVPDAPEGTEYFYRLDGSLNRPDPASRAQPHGVHGPSQVIDPRTFSWTDRHYRPPALSDMVIYELHVGTFTPKRTFQGVIERLDDLVAMGINAIELLPVAQFPGTRNWGYDGVFPFAAHSAYGGAKGLAELVDAAHARRVAIILDVVYNHLGPEGNYLRDYGPYFTDWYTTPWGEALNFDGPYSDEVRAFFIENARYWLEDLHIDGFRLDAVKKIIDNSARPFLEELATRVEQLSIRTGKERVLIAESLGNDSRVIRPREHGGLGMHSEWLDDFHHALHALLTGERFGYYQDFGEVEQLRRSFSEAYTLSGQYSHYRRRRFGNSAADCDPTSFVTYIQNHDQIGNRPFGDRIGETLNWEARKLAAGAVLLSPYVPMIFMGEEYDDPAPFLYFVSHGEPHLVQQVRSGRRRDFPEISRDRDVPDPQDEMSFERSTLDWSLRNQGRHALLAQFYRELIRLRRAVQAIPPDEPPIERKQLPPDEQPLLQPQLTLRERLSVQSTEETVAVVRRTAEGLVVVLLNFALQPREIHFEGEYTEFQVLLDSSARRWDGPGTSNPEHLAAEHTIRLNPRSIVLLVEGPTGP